MAYLLERGAAELGGGARVLLNLSGRGDKDMGNLSAASPDCPAAGPDAHGPFC